MSVTSQELLSKYKQLGSNTNKIVQTQWGSLELNEKQFKNCNNLISKNIIYSKRSPKVKNSSIPSLLIQLGTNGYPTYKFNGIDTIYQQRQENNIFLSNLNNFEDIIYKTEDFTFVEIPPSSIESATDEEAAINSREGVGALNYNYSYFDLSLRFFSDESFVGTTTILGGTKTYDYTRSPSFNNDTTLLLNNVFNKPQGINDKALVISGYMMGFGLTLEQANELYDYIQNVLNILKANTQVKVRNVINFSTINYFLIKNAETDANITIPSAPSFILDRALGLQLGTVASKYADEFSSYDFAIGRTRNYQINRVLGEPFLLKTTDFGSSTLQPSPIVLPLPYTPSNSGLQINLSNQEFSIIVSDEDNTVLQPADIPSSLVVDITGRFFYKLTKGGSVYEELKAFSFSFSGGELEGDFRFGAEFIFDSPYVSYYLVIDSFDVQI